MGTDELTVDGLLHYSKLTNVAASLCVWSLSWYGRALRLKLDLPKSNRYWKLKFLFFGAITGNFPLGRL